MLSERMLEAINKQINAEIFSSYLYLSMAAYFAANDLPGFENWMKAQAQEELFHAVKLFNYLNESSGRAVMAPIEGPQTEWSSPLDVFENALNHERKVTGLINELVALAREEKDFATDNFLQWFVAEQVEEEASADGVIKKIRLIGGQGSGMFMLDKELGQRVFIMPAAETEQ